MAKKKTQPRVRFQTGNKVGRDTEPEMLEPLTEVDQFYIDNNPSLTDAEAAVKIGKSSELIAKYRTERKGKTHANRMLHRPAKHVVAMTEASSMASEDKDRDFVYEIEVKRAIAEGDLEKAAELQKRVNEQREATEAKKKVMYSDRIHYIK